jgi:hypothetical protein
MQPDLDAIPLTGIPGSWTGIFLEDTAILRRCGGTPAGPFQLTKTPPCLGHIKYLIRVLNPRTRAKQLAEA